VAAVFVDFPKNICNFLHKNKPDIVRRVQFLIGRRLFLVGSRHRFPHVEVASAYDVDGAGERPFACSWPDCSWRFSRSDELARHARSHSGVRPYPCRLCDKRFARSDHLAKHLRVHRKHADRPTPSRLRPEQKI